MYARIVNEELKLCEVGLGDDIEFYKSLGMVDMEVEEGYDHSWYVKGYAPKKVVTREEVEQIRSEVYLREVDPLTAQISRLRDEEQTPEIVALIEELKLQRSAKVAEIKEQNPYPVEDKPVEEVKPVYSTYSI